VSSVYASAFLFGGILGPVVGGVLGNLGLRVPFLVYAVALLVAATLVGVFLSGSSLRPADGAPELPVMSVRDGWADNAYRASIGSAFANGWANFGVRNAILPLFAAAVIGKEPWVAGTVLAVFAAGNAVGLTVAGRLSDRLGRRPFIVGGLLVSGLATIVTGFASDLPTLVVLSVVAGVGAGTLNPAQQAALADVVGRHRNGGPALAAFQMSSDTGAIIGPVLAGILIDHGSYPLAFGTTGLITLLAVLPWLRARETHDVRHGALPDAVAKDPADVADCEARVGESSREA
jgi:MFS family permease